MASVELEGLIGFFVNSLAMRADLAGEPSFRELVSRVRRAALDAYQHQDLPLKSLLRSSTPERDMSRHPLFQVMFALQNAPREALELPGVEVSRQLLPSVSMRFDLELHVWERRGRLERFIGLQPGPFRGSDHRRDGAPLRGAAGGDAGRA